MTMNLLGVTAGWDAGPEIAAKSSHGARLGQRLQLRILWLGLGPGTPFGQGGWHRARGTDHHG